MKLKLPGAASKLWFIPPVVIGALALAYLARSREQPPRLPPVERSRVLRVVPVAQTEVLPRVAGNGTARPGQVWRAVAEIKGRLLAVHPDLEAGAIIPGGTEMLSIDATEYQLQVARLEASIEQVSAQLDELEVLEADTGASLEIERESLDLAKQARERSAKLLAKGSSPQSQVDADQRAVLAQRQIVQSLESTLNQLPSRRSALAASAAVQEADLARARLDLAHAAVKAPFDCRIAAASLEVGQYVQLGEPLFEAHGTAVTEVEVQMPISRLQTLLAPTEAGGALPGMDMGALRTVFDVDAVVRLRVQDRFIEWPARFDRIREGIDARTRTAGVVVAVDQPYAGAIPGKRPPLVGGMFCEVELRGQPRGGRIMIPRIALRGGDVFVLSSENRLERRAVNVEFVQGSYACLAGGLVAGERLVISDPTPAVEGMLVVPVVDEAAVEAIAAAARGEADLR